MMQIGTPERVAPKPATPGARPAPETPSPPPVWQSAARLDVCRTSAHPNRMPDADGAVRHTRTGGPLHAASSSAAASTAAGAASG